jgi:hypothetical protein
MDSGVFSTLGLNNRTVQVLRSTMQKAVRRRLSSTKVGVLTLASFWQIFLVNHTRGAGPSASACYAGPRNSLVLEDRSARHQAVDAAAAVGVNN